MLDHKLQRFLWQADLAWADKQLSGRDGDRATMPRANPLPAPVSSEAAPQTSEI